MHVMEEERKGAKLIRSFWRIYNDNVYIAWSTAVVDGRGRGLVFWHRGSHVESGAQMHATVASGRGMYENGRESVYRVLRTVRERTRKKG